jgi:1-aminocyclopropane-1-carboxylate deaminase/D-cysteine desulfhydrase-like pyridoxal-dependent ACC family enzyme
MAGLIDQVRQGAVRPQETVVFIHTGGLPLNFAYSTELAQAFDLSLETDQWLT